MAKLAAVGTAVVAGSGLALRGLFDAEPRQVAFEEIPGLARSGVAGHRGRFLIGACGGAPLALQEGRLHLYEGRSYEETTRTVDALASWGIRRLIFTNAAGGLRPDLTPGALLAVERVGLWPCRRWPGHPSRMRPDFLLEGLNARGSYLWVHGPSYETPAEIRAMQRLGHSAVGMSAAPELRRAQSLGLTAAVVSCVTNSCGAGGALTHEEVLRVASRASSRLTALLREPVAASVPP
jgi:purine-nucleoside phosphorylase